MNMPDTPPTYAEIKDQVRRMLMSPRFKNAQRPADFLALVVSRALRGKRTHGRIIAERLFQGKFLKDETSDVRVTASNLRKTIAKYYENEGRDDTVIVSFPKASEDKSIKSRRGEAYMPHFSYNPNIRLMLGLRIAASCLERWTYTQLLRAFEIYWKLLQEYPNHLGPTLGVIEASCEFDNRGWQNPEFADWATECNARFGELESAAADYWRYWAVRGYFHCLLDETQHAVNAFQRALALNRSETELYSPYVIFLLKQGNQDEAITLANNYLNLHLSESIALAKQGMFMVMAGRLQAAADHLQGALTFDPGNAVAHELLALIWIWQGDLTRVLSHVQMCKTLYDPISYGVAMADLERAASKLEIEISITALLEQGANASAGEIEKH